MRPIVMKWKHSSWLMVVSIATVVGMDQLTRYLVRDAPQSFVAGIFILVAMNMEAGVWGQVFAVFSDKFPQPVTGKHILFSLSSSALSAPLAMHMLGASGTWSWLFYTVACVLGVTVLWFMGGDAAIVAMGLGITQGNVSRLVCTPNAIILPAIMYALTIQFMEVKEYVEEWPGAAARVKLWTYSFIGAAIALTYAMKG